MLVVFPQVINIAKRYKCMICRGAELDSGQRTRLNNPSIYVEKHWEEN